MSHIIPYEGVSPHGTIEDMCQIYTDDIALLTFDNAISDAGVYTLHFWVKSDNPVAFTIKSDSLNEMLTSTAEWTEYTFTFNAVDSDVIEIKLPITTYYFYHFKLEAGEVATAYTEELIKPLVFGKLTNEGTVSIYNISDDDIGFIYRITCNGEVYNPAIYHIESNTHIKIKGAFKLNDVITIDTRRGKKSISKSYRGITKNIINDLVNTSKWLKLQSGNNHIIQSAEEGAEYMDSVLIYTSEYEGV